MKSVFVVLALSTGALAASPRDLVLGKLDRKVQNTQWNGTFAKLKWNIKMTGGPKGDFRATKYYEGKDGYEASLYAIGKFKIKGGKAFLKIKQFGIAE